MRFKIKKETCELDLPNRPGAMEVIQKPADKR